MNHPSVIIGVKPIECCSLNSHLTRPLARPRSMAARAAVNVILRDKGFMCFVTRFITSDLRLDPPRARWADHVVWLIMGPSTMHMAYG